MLIPKIFRSHGASDAVQGYWIVSERAGADERRDINFQKFNGEVPGDQTKLKNDVERTLSSLYILYPTARDKQKFDAYFDKLLSLSQVGLVGVRPSTTTAADALASLHSEILDQEAGRVKNSYLRRVGLWGLALLAPTVVISVVLTIWVPASGLRDVYRNVALIWSACMVGTWLSVASRKLTMSFFDLAKLEEDRLDPSIRLVFTGLLTAVLALLLYTGVVTITVGAFHANDWSKLPQNSLLLGALAGIGEKALPANILPHAAALLRGGHTAKAGA